MSLAEAWNAADLTADVDVAEAQFASVRVDACANVLEYAGIDLPALGLFSIGSARTNLVDRWRESEHLHGFMQHVLAGEVTSITVRSLEMEKDGRPRVHRVFGWPIREDEGGGANLMAFRVPRNYVSSRDYQARLKSAAETDVLTEATNRRGFNEELESVLSSVAATGHRGAVIFMDLDDFKAVNDTLGHAAGDELLVSVTRCLRENIRSNDLLARLGGDEFAVLLQDINGEVAMEVARKLLRVVREHQIMVEGHAISNTVSIGVALYPEHGATAGELLQHADMAMYSVKGSGRNDVAMFNPKELSRFGSARRLRWKHSVAEALVKDRFLFHAQPIVNLSGGQIWSHELLLRLRDDHNRLVLPGSFLETAERSGLISDIDAWVAHESIRLCRDLQKAGVDTGLSFNLSGKALNGEDLLASIKRDLIEYKVDASRLCIEVTETAAISNVRQAQRFLKSIRSLGVRVALDDFGAGFSSFSQLKNLAVDYLKIDGTFIKDLPRSISDQHFARAIAEVARGLGMQVIAEFVGDAETVELLREYGIEYGQGYYLGKPASLPEAFGVSELAA